jgi:8-oxo-dGTP diphosphatase
MAGGRLLVVRHAYDPVAGQWAFPGGGIEAGELPKGALAREVREELHVVPTVLGLLAVHHYGQALYIFGMRVDAARIRPDGREITEAAWLDRAALAELHEQGRMLSPRDWWMAERLFARGRLPAGLQEAQYRPPADAQSGRKTAELYVAWPQTPDPPTPGNG